jgi:TolB-like protein/class 3 adenylate cyclase/Flp pilus assembly protein TadD
MQRRLASILVADVAGYSRLMSLDESGTHRRLMAFRAETLEPLIAEHEGRIVNYTGDGILAEFFSVVRAVECALSVQRAAAKREPDIAVDQRLALRVGLHCGDIIVEGSSIYGDGVNVAARLEQLAEPGGVCMSERVYDEIAGKVEVKCEYGGEPVLKNISHRVPVWFWPTSDRAGGAPRLLAPVDKPSLAVLPFEDLNAAAAGDAFADGIVEDLTTALGRLRWLFVVARTSAYALKGQPVDVHEVGNRLGVRYLLEGSVRRSGQTLRITAQLIHVESGAHLWAERFEGKLEAVFDLQDQIVATTIAALEPHLLSAEGERARRARPEDMNAHQYYLRANQLIGAVSTNPIGGALEEARTLLAKAIELDPIYCPALALAGYFEAQALVFGRHPDLSAGKRHAVDLVERAVRADGTDPFALGFFGFVSATEGGDLDRAVAFVERAVELNPNSSLLWHFAGSVQSYVGAHERAIECLHRSMRLNPLDQRTISNASNLAFAHLFLGQPEEAVRWAERAVLFAKNPPGLRILAASLAAAGRSDEARNVIQNLLEIQPNSCLSRSRTANYRRPEDLELYVESLRRAGLPEEPTGRLAEGGAAPM